MFRLLWVVFCLLTLVSGVWALGPDEVFIQNKGAAVTNSPVIVPISFQDGQMSKAQLSTVQLKSAGENLPTQADATSYYKSGFVRTAVARVIVSLSANQEKIFTIGTYAGAPPAFVMDPRVDALLKNGQLKVQVTDIKGGTYETKVDVDSPQYSGHVTLVSDGPVAKVYRIVKRQDPVAGGVTEDLSYLFTSIFFVTAYTGKDYVLVDHFIANSNNLDEDPAPTVSGGNYIYANPQHGAIFYTDAKIQVDTGSSNHWFYTLDSSVIYPSGIDTTNSTSASTTFFIMPENGQQLLKDTYGEGPSSIGQQNNFIGSGQGFLTRFAISFGGALSSHPTEESSINSGQSLERWSKVDSYLFRDLPNPEKINPGFNWESEATETWNDMLSGVTQSSENHRFSGTALSGKKNLNAPGYYDHYYQEPRQVIQYLLSCQTKCQKKLLDAMRFRQYGMGYASEYAIGFEAQEHPNSFFLGYDSALIENGVGSAPNFVSTCANLYGSKDIIGYCHPTKGTPASHRIDKFGQPITQYESAWEPRGLWHDWTMSSTSHFSNGMEYYRYLLAGDNMAKYMGDAKLQVSVLSIWQYWISAYNSGHPFYESQTRGRGRGLKNISFANSLSPSTYYKTVGEYVLTSIDLVRNKDAPGSKGQNPYAMGDDFPVKYFNDDTVPGKNWEILPFHHHLVGQGLGVAYLDLFSASDASAITKLKNIVKDGLFFEHEYGYRHPTEVRNGVTVTYNGVNYSLDEGQGYTVDYYHTQISLPPNSEPLKSTPYPGTRQPEEQPGLVAMLVAASEMRKADPSFMPEFDSYYADFKEAYRGVWSSGAYKYIGTNPDTWGLSLTDLFDEEFFGMSFFQGIPSSSGRGYVNGYFSSSYSPACPDADGDGLTTCAGDCADNNPAIGSNRSETSCTDGLDNNCNLLVDCNDPVCGEYTQATNGSWSINNGACNGKPYCGNGVIDAGEQCEVSPSQQGKFTPINPVPPYTCVAAFTSLYAGCVYASTSSFFLTSIVPSSIAPNAAATLTLNGGGFASSNKVTIGSLTNLTPINVTATQMTISLSASQTASLGNGAHSVSVKEGTSSTNSLTLSISSPKPTIASLTPTTLFAYGTTLVSTLTGTNFSANAKVTIQSGVNATLLSITPSSVSSTQIVFTPTIAQLNSLGIGFHSVRVDNQDGQVSDPLTISTFLPTISTLSPLAVSDGSNQLFTLNGTLFLSGAQVKVGSLPLVNTTYNNQSQVTFALNTTQLQSLGPGVHSTYIQNPGGGQSNSVSLTVLGTGSPMLDSLTPNQSPVGAPVTISILGSGFQSTSKVWIGTTSFTPTFVDSSHLTLALSGAQSSALGFNVHSVKIENSGLNSNTLPYVIYLPTLSTMVPNNIVENAPATIQLNGTFFDAGAVVHIGSFTFTPSVITPTQITLPLSLANVQSLGTGTKLVNVQNVGGGTSTNLQLVVNFAPVAAPSQLVATPGTSSIALTWLDNASNETGYTVERSTDNILFTPFTPSLGANAKTFTDSGLAPGTYFYRVVAFNANSTSPYSNTASATIGGSSGEAPPAADVVSVSISAPTTVPANLSWSATVSLSKLQPDGAGYSNVKTLVGVTLCRVDDPDPLKSATCAASDYPTLQQLLFIINVPQTATFYLNQQSYNFNSLYPASFLSPSSIPQNAFVTDAGPNSFTYSFTPNALGLVPGTYRVLAIALPAQYAYDPAQNGITSVTETTTGNNSTGLTFTVTEPLSPGTTPPATPPSSSGGGDSGSGSNSGSGSSSGGEVNEPNSCEPFLEMCDGIDNDCDDQIDEGCGLTIGEAGVDSCYNFAFDQGEEGIDCGGTCSRSCTLSSDVGIFAWFGVILQFLVGIVQIVVGPTA